MTITDIIVGLCMGSVAGAIGVTIADLVLFGEFNHTALVALLLACAVIGIFASLETSDDNNS